MSGDDPIHLYERPKFRNFCGAKQWVDRPFRTNYTSYGAIPKAGQLRVDAHPRARQAKIAADAECHPNSPTIAAIITIHYLTSEEAVLIPTEKLCPACYLFWSVMQANGLKTKAETRRLMQKALEEKPK